MTRADLLEIYLVQTELSGCLVTNCENGFFSTFERHLSMKVVRHYDPESGNTFL